MAGIGRVLAALAVWAPLMAGSAQAFSTVTVNGTNADGLPRVTDTGEPPRAHAGEEPPSADGGKRIEGSVSFGAQYQSSSHATISGYPPTPFTGAGADVVLHGNR